MEGPPPTELEKPLNKRQHERQKKKQAVQKRLQQAMPANTSRQSKSPDSVRENDEVGEPEHKKPKSVHEEDDGFSEDVPMDES